MGKIRLQTIPGGVGRRCKPLKASELRNGTDATSSQSGKKPAMFYDSAAFPGRS
jgi:hypothetical protein